MRAANSRWEATFSPGKARKCMSPRGREQGERGRPDVRDRDLGTGIGTPLQRVDEVRPAGSHRLPIGLLGELSDNDEARSVAFVW